MYTSTELLQAQHLRTPYGNITRDSPLRIWESYFSVGLNIFTCEKKMISHVSLIFSQATHMQMLIFTCQIYIITYELHTFICGWFVVICGLEFPPVAKKHGTWNPLKFVYFHPFSHVKCFKVNIMAHVIWAFSQVIGFFQMEMTTFFVCEWHAFIFDWLMYYWW